MRRGGWTGRRREERLRAIAKAKGGSAENSIPVVTPMALGARSRVVLNSGESVPVQYAVVEVDWLITSHRGVIYERDPRFPAEAQPRSYGDEFELQYAVEQRANNLDPLQVLTDSSLPIDGPPVVRRDGVVISGNGRSQSMVLAMKLGLYEEVARGIRERAGHFKFDPAEVASVRRPVLVRLMVEDVTDSASLARYGIEMNRDPAQGMSSSEQALGLARLMTPGVVMQLADMVSELPEGYTVREFMRRRPKDIASVLSAGGLVDSRKRAAYFLPDGGLTETAKELIETILAGGTVTDIGVFRDASPSSRDRLVRAGVEFMRARSAGKEWDLAAFNTEAVRLVTEAESRASYLRRLKSRGDNDDGSLVERLLYPERFRNADADLGLHLQRRTHPAVQALARALEEDPREYLAIIAGYASKALRGADTLFEGTHPAHVFSATVGRRRGADGELRWELRVLPEEWEPAHRESTSRRSA